MAHEWFNYCGQQCCKRCGIIRRTDNKKGLCRQDVKVALRPRRRASRPQDLCCRRGKIQSRAANESRSGRNMGTCRGRDQARRTELMPDEAAALRLLTDAIHRLKELGFNDATYIPKDGSMCELVEDGSSGIHKGYWSYHSAGKRPRVCMGAVSRRLVAVPPNPLPRDCARPARARIR